uniref:Uncharacterized protein n=1 Tax=Amphora coffeiformis TaxID=265554 RepID=A0A7S3LEE3_9STRA
MAKSKEPTTRTDSQKMTPKQHPDYKAEKAFQTIKLDLEDRKKPNPEHLAFVRDMATQGKVNAEQFETLMRDYGLKQTESKTSMEPKREREKPVETPEQAKKD